MLSPADRPADGVHSAYSAPGAAQGIFALLGAVPVLRERAQDRRTEVDLARAPASIAFEEVTFRYRPDGEAALDGLSFGVSPGSAFSRSLC